MKLFATTALTLALSATVALAGGHCAAGKTIKDGVLTVATGNPAYFPWVIDDAPESKQGFEAAVAYAVAEKMGFADDAVEWTRTSFDQAIQPGPKDFDFNLQQYSITAEREEMVDFSAPYYASAMAVLTRKPVVEGGATAEMASLKSLKWGVHSATTALSTVTQDIQPDSSPLLYDDSADVVEALKANQIDAAMFDLPTALYLGAVVLDDGVILGQFLAGEGAAADEFGLLMADGNPLKECVDSALAELKADGTLAAIEAQWLSETTGVPVIK